MHKSVTFVLAAQLVSASVSQADEAAMCEEFGIDISGAWYECRALLEKQNIDRYPAIATRSDDLLTLVAENSHNQILENKWGESRFYLVAHYPEYSLSLISESRHEWSTRHIFSHRNGQYLKVSGWPAFSDDGSVIVFFGDGDSMSDESYKGILAIYSRFILRVTGDYVEDYIEQMAIFHTQMSWFTAVTFQSNSEFSATMECRELVDLPDVGEHWMVTGQTEEVSFHYNGGIWRPSKLKQCAKSF